jgi:hypothetical protein
MLVSPWIRRGLFVVALLAIPFPYRVVESGRVPAAWLGAVATLAGSSAVWQGGSISAVIARWFAIQAGIAIVLAYLAARLAAMIVRRTVSPARQWPVFAALAAGALGLALVAPLFATTAVAGGAPTTLLGVFGLR